MIITCWMGVVIWIGYVVNMTMYADVRYAGVVFPVIGWWLYDIFYITPFVFTYGQPRNLLRLTEGKHVLCMPTRFNDFDH
jgi:hypothetical protein